MTRRSCFSIATEFDGVGSALQQLWFGLSIERGADRTLMRTLNYLLTGPRPVIVAISTLACWLSILAYMLDSPIDAWRWLDFYNREQWLDVHKSMPAFYDASVITYFADCARSGGDPYAADGCDAHWAGDTDPRTPLPFPFNYPPVWLEVARIGFSPAATVVLGLAVALLTIVSLASIFRPSTPIGGLITLATILSPPMLFGFELGNSDFFVFSLVVLVIMVTSRFNYRKATLIRGIGIILLSVLKFYPISICAIFLREGRGAVYGFIFAVLSAVAILVSSLGRMHDILINTPKFGYAAFGSMTALLSIQEMSGFAIDHIRIYSTLAASVILVLSVGYVLIATKGRWPRLIQPLASDNPLRDIALAGLSVYVLCFLLGSNLNYRLIFIVGVVPLFIEAYEYSRRNIDLIVPSIIISLLWLSRFGQEYFLDQVAAWVLFVVGVISLARAALPRRVIQPISRMPAI